MSTDRVVAASPAAAGRSIGRRILDLRSWRTLSSRERIGSLVPVIVAVVLLAVLVAIGLAPSLLAIALGVGAAVAYFVIANKAIDRAPTRWSERIRPWLFVTPALLFLAGWLLYPAIRTFTLSLSDARGDSFVGLDNFSWAFTTDEIITVFRNNVFWLIGVTFFSTAFGLTMAVLADKMKWESFWKSLIFLPMAISFVGASVIWRFVYAFRPDGVDQIGILNEIVVGLGGSPQAWLLLEPWNNFFLIVVMIWLQTGFAMVVLAAAIKGVPTELIEAARIDGANEWQVFRKITMPSIAGTMAVVITTTVILVLKVFDIVRVMTAGQFETNVIANEMITQSFQLGDQGRGAALAVVLFAAVIPVLIWNIRGFRREGGGR